MLSNPVNIYIYLKKGPLLHDSPCTSIEVIKKIMNNEVPMLPDLYMPICDVRTVALAHMLAMQLDEAQNHRHIVTSGRECLSFKEIAHILQGEFKNYKIPKKVGPNIFVRCISLFDKTVKQVKDGFAILKV